MYRIFLRRNILKKGISLWVLCAIVLIEMGALTLTFPAIIEAARVSIDTAASNVEAEHIVAGATSVFISDQVGYKFYVDSTGTCVYSKTLNGGTSWSAASTTDAQADCATPAVWYDQWTPGDTGTYIHIVTQDQGGVDGDDLRYNRLDTTNDSRLLGTVAVNVTQDLGYVGTLGAGNNYPAITKGTDGTLYVGISDGSDSLIVECSSGCGTASNWTETGTTPLDNQNDPILLLPQAGGDIMLIRRDLNTEDIQYQIWNNSAWPGVSGWSTIDSNARDNATYDVMISAIVNDDFEVFLAYLDAVGFTTANDHDLRTAKYSSSAWTNTANVITDYPGGLTNVALGLDANNDNVYVAFSGRATIGTITSADVYYATSTSEMSTWSAVSSALSGADENIYGVAINHRSDQRIYVSWYGDTTTDVFGDTLADVSPITVVDDFGSQRATLRASTSAAHVGGTFVISENVTSRNVTSITITETGTIDAATGIGDVALYYELDTASPYDCATNTFDGIGSEEQFGITDTNGFSSADGISIFTDVIGISPTQSLCIYPVVEVVKAAADGTTLEIEIDNPATDVLVSGSVMAVPTQSVALSGTTNIVDDDLTQTHFHFRDDTGDELGATSRTGGVQDTDLGALQKETPTRMRFGISNEGSTSTFSTTLQLEYAPIAGTCSTVSSWTDVGATDDDWNMSPTSNIVDGANTTDIALASGGVDNENSSFLTTNGGQRDENSTLGALTFSPTNWTEVEFSIVASSSATEGQTYCFRLSDNGVAFSSYDVYPQVTISADVTVRATSTQTATVDIPTNNVYVGGAFTIAENASTRSVSSITLTEQGTVDAALGLDNIRLFYDLDTTAPYNCQSVSYDGDEVQYGATNTDSFSSANGTSTFTGSLTIATTSTACLYSVLDVTSTAQNGETIDIVIQSGSTDVVVSGGGSVAPATVLDITGSTTLRGAILDQFGYHWRLDNGSEVAASSSVGSENQAETEFPLNDSIRLRLGVDNTGPTSSVPTSFRLEYGIKITACDAIGVWTDVDAAPDAWDMFETGNLTNGFDTTDVSTTTAGGLTNPSGQSFLSPNGGVRDTESTTGSLTLTETQFVELEYSITSTATTSYETDYCFRVTNLGTELNQYSTYAELTTAAKRDFRVQRGTTIVTGFGVTVLAGTSYTAPASTSTAFVRITNMHHTGAGRTVADNVQESDDETAYISNASDITTSFTISRPGNANDTVVSWEIVEFIGEPGTDNEMIVRNVSTVNLTGTNLIATGTAVDTITNDDDVVVFITGSANANTGSTAYYNGQVTSAWSSTSSAPVFERIGTGSNVSVSYAVVEFKGVNWRIQRIENPYESVNTTETVSMTAVNSISRTFLHTQKRMAALTSQANFGHEVWISSIGAISFRLSLNATTTGGQTSVAWVIENTQTSQGKMVVQQDPGSISGGVEPRTTTLTFTNPVAATNNTSVFSMSAFQENTTNFPRVLGGVILTSTTTYQIYNSDIIGTTPYYYRTEIVEWPTTGLSVRQENFWLYADSNTLTPNDPWPLGATDIGENEILTSLFEPIAEGERIRIRMSVEVRNATLPAGLRTYQLQYAQRITTCTAVETWTDVGGVASGAIWRGYNTSVSDGTTLTTLLLSGSTVAGVIAETGLSAANPLDANDLDVIEYDWVVEHNGAIGSTVYCFRMINNDDSTLDGYSSYPQLRTAGFTPVSDGWRWFSDQENETPVSALAAENAAPIDIANDSDVALRVTVDEIKGVDGNNVKFKLQFSDDPSFANARDVVATSSCLENSLWCYIDGGGTNNALISTTTLSGSDSCVAGVGSGCGTHNASAVAVAGDTHDANARREYSYTIQNAGARVNTVYYFRLYDVANGASVQASSTYPSLVTEGAQLAFTLDGIASGTVSEGVTSDVDTAVDAISFGQLPLAAPFEAIYRLTVNTTATEGYRIFMYATQPLINSYGIPIPYVTGTNAAPTSWATGCSGASDGCFGYHSGDDILSNGSTRFSADDTYAALSTTPEEVMASTIPSDDTVDIVFRVQITELQAAGSYDTNVVYIAVPIF